MYREYIVMILVLLAVILSVSWIIYRLRDLRMNILSEIKCNFCRFSLVQE